MMGSHNETTKLIACWQRRLEPAGWRVTKAGHHWLFWPPDRAHPPVSVASSMSGGSSQKALAHLRRAGAQL